MHYEIKVAKEGLRAGNAKNLKRSDAIPRSADEPWQPMHFIR